MGGKAEKIDIGCLLEVRDAALGFEVSEEDLGTSLAGNVAKIAGSADRRLGGGEEIVAVLVAESSGDERDQLLRASRFTLGIDDVLEHRCKLWLGDSLDGRVGTASPINVRPALKEQLEPERTDVGRGFLLVIFWLTDVDGVGEETHNWT